MEIVHYSRLILAGFVICGIVIHILGLIGLLVFRFKKIKKLEGRGPFPGVSIIKPCLGNGDNEEVNFDAYFNQDYPGKIQIIFVVSNENDPIVPTIRSYLKRYPSGTSASRRGVVDAQLVISKTRKAYWMKVDALYDAHQKVNQEFIIWSDSDAIVRSNYVSQMVSCLQERGVSVVTTPQYDARINNFATALKAVGNNCDVGIYVMLYNLINHRKKGGWGHSLGFRRSEFEKFGGEAWETLGNSYVDDTMLTLLFFNQGKKIVYRNIYCPVQYTNKTLKQMFDQQERFALCQKALFGKWKFMAGLLLFPVIPATLCFAIAPNDPLGLQLLGLSVGIRIFSSFLFEALILGTIHMNLRYFWTIPIWDLLHIYFYFHAYFRESVTYHGRTFRFTKGTHLKKIKDRLDPDSEDKQWNRPDTGPSSARSSL